MSESPPRLSEEDRQEHWRVYFGIHAKAQETFDSSVRAMAAGGVATTVSLATALHALASLGIAAVALFLLSLGCNLASYATAQADMRARLERVARYEYASRSRWSLWTFGLNVAAGVALISGGAALGAFVGTTA